jgi:chromate transporter
VVGVIVNLALFFGYHVLWPEGFDGALDWPSALIALGAALALFGLKLSVMKTLGLCALAGLLVQWLI